MAKKSRRRRADRLERAVTMASEKSHRRRAAAAAEPWRKVTVVLKDRQILFLDRLALEIRARTGAAIARAEIIRALIDALEAAGIDLTQATSEAQLRDLVLSRL